MEYACCLGLIYILTLCLNFKSGETINTADHPETQLQKHIFVGYNRYVRPSVNNGSITVDISLALNHVVNLNEIKQTLTVSVSLGFKWKDGLLVWDEIEYAGKKSVIVPSSRIWLPDIINTNSVKAAYGVGFNSLARAKLFADGTVAIWTQQTTDVTCDIRTKKFPFDIHRCELLFSTSISDITEVNLTATKRNINLGGYKEVAEWDIIENYVSIDMLQENDVHNNRTTYTALAFQLTFKRNCKMCILNNLLPVLLLSTLNLLTFFVPISSGEKLAFPMSIFLSVAIFLAAINGTLPEAVDGVSYLAIWITLELGFCAMTLCCTVIILYLHYRMGDLNVPDLILGLRCVRKRSKTRKTPGNCRNSVGAELNMSQNNHTTNVPVSDLTVEHDCSTPEENIDNACKLQNENMPDTKWKDVCEIFDKLFFLVFLFGQVLTAVIFIVLFSL